MKKIKDISLLISDIKISDIKVKRELEKLNLDSGTEEERADLMTLLQLKRPVLFRNWQIEIVNHYR